MSATQQVHLISDRGTHEELRQIHVFLWKDCHRVGASLQHAGIAVPVCLLARSLPSSFVFPGIFIKAQFSFLKMSYKDRNSHNLEQVRSVKSP